MIRVDIISGFLGAGKTTLIKKLIAEAFSGEKLVLIENEFGEIGVDGGFLKEAGIEITEMNSGCICCSLVGDFGTALADVITRFSPDRILIEPSGVGKLSDVVKAVQGVTADKPLVVSSRTTVVDATKLRMYRKNFGEFFNNQLAYASTIVLSRTQKLSAEKLAACVAQIREENEAAVVITTPWEQLNGAQMLAAMEAKNQLAEELLKEAMQEAVCPECGQVHEHAHDHEHDHGECHHEHEHDHGECHHEHEHGECRHEHDHGECHHEHEHDHDHGDCHHEHDHEDCHHEHEHDHGDCHHEHDHDHESCHHEHDHEHHHAHGHHHADEVFVSWGKETPQRYDRSELQAILEAFSADTEGTRFGIVLRAKGIVQEPEGGWLQFDYVPGEFEVREGTADYTGRLCVIGSQLKTEELEAAFLLK